MPCVKFTVNSHVSANCGCLLMDSSFVFWYRGEFKGSFRHGRGSLSVPQDSLEFQGTWFRGKRNGIGKVVFPDGEHLFCFLIALVIVLSSDCNQVCACTHTALSNIDVA